MRRRHLAGKAARKQCPARAALLNKSLVSPQVPPCPATACWDGHAGVSLLPLPARRVSPARGTRFGGAAAWWAPFASRARKSPGHPTEGAPPPQKPHPREMAAKPTDPSPSSPPSPSGGVCAPGLPLCRQQVEYCRCGRLKCRRHNGGLCPIRHARAPLWKAHTRGDTALAPAIMPAA